jgi:membrane protein implicated in regulation of membrane protease activity
MEALLPFKFWYWWIAGVILLGLEMMIPGTFMLWLGVAATAVGFIVLIFPALDWQIQLTLFGVLSIISVIGWLQWRSRHPGTDAPSTLNRRAEQYVGQVFTLDQATTNGHGRVRVEDTSWKIATVDGGDLAEGAKARVTATDGIVLKVEAV